MKVSRAVLILFASTVLTVCGGLQAATGQDLNYLWGGVLGFSLGESRDDAVLDLRDNGFQETPSVDKQDNAVSYVEVPHYHNDVLDDFRLLLSFGDHGLTSVSLRPELPVHPDKASSELLQKIVDYFSNLYGPAYQGGKEAITQAALSTIAARKSAVDRYEWLLEGFAGQDMLTLTIKPAGSSGQETAGLDVEIAFHAMTDEERAQLEAQTEKDNQLWNQLLGGS